MKNLVLISFLFIVTGVQSQEILESRRSSYFSYAYKIDKALAKKLCAGKIKAMDEKHLKGPIDTLITDSIGKLNYPAGHYIIATTYENKEKYSYYCVQDIDVHIVNNSTDLIIQVYDSIGTIVTDAKLKVGGKRMHYDKKTKSFVIRKSNTNNILAVDYYGSVSFFNLKRQYNNPAIRRTTNKVLQTTRLHYALMPVEYIIKLPIDGFKSIKYYSTVGVIARTRDAAVNTFNKVACLFDDYYCDNYNSRYRGFLVYSKPKYKPNDTVKFKAYILNSKDKPLHTDLNVVLSKSYKDKIILASIKPYTRGAYKYSFVLHDSLDLLLDKPYNIRLEKPGGQYLLQNNFYFEEYELNNISLDVEPYATAFYKGDSVKVKVNAKDENDLNLPDAHLNVTLTHRSVAIFLDTLSIIPDTLYITKTKLDENTIINIPDSVFQNTNIRCNLCVELLTADNKRKTECRNFDFYSYDAKVVETLRNDSIFFDYQLNGQSCNTTIKTYTIDHFGNKKLLKHTSLPFGIKVNPYQSKYIFEIDSSVYSINMDETSADIQCYTHRTADSVLLDVDNPHSIPFSYHIYKTNKEIYRGYDKSLKLAYKSSLKHDYFVILNYLWAGEMNTTSYRIPLRRNDLNIDIKQPELVFPGQTTEIEIQVTDFKGKPVENVDLTAFSNTAKFNFTAPNVPDFSKPNKSKEIINTFSLKQFNEEIVQELDYYNWKTLAGIDSVEYYKFLYPENGIYQTSYKSNNGTTQFSIYVTDNGKLLPLHVIYCNNEPVYFSWSTNERPYSFKAYWGENQIKVRTTNALLIIENINMNWRHKNIISVDINNPPANVKVIIKKNKLDKYEKALLYKYIFPYKNNFGENTAYIEQSDAVHSLKNESGAYPYYAMVGPLKPGEIQFNIVDSTQLNFIHEPFYQYEIKEPTVKMRSQQSRTYHYPNNLSPYYSKLRTSLKDEVWTKETMQDIWQQYLYSKRQRNARYYQPNKTSIGKGKISLDLQIEANRLLLNTLVFKHGDTNFVRISKGSARQFHDLAPGTYKLIFFYSGGSYHYVDSIRVESNSLTHLKMKCRNTYAKDEFSERVNEIIEKNIFNPRNYVQYNNELEEINDVYNRAFIYSGKTKTVSGYVYDEYGEAIPGATIVVPGTRIGTISNLDGYYSFQVPENATQVEVLYVGYTTEKVNISNTTYANATISADVLALEEVVVIGYGVQKKASIVGSVSYALQGRSLGVAVQNTLSPGAANSLQIRGLSANSGDSPLVILNGKVYEGDISKLTNDKSINVEVLKGTSATAIYGSRAANGVILITADDYSSTSIREVPLFDNAFYEAARTASSLRNNFSDEAFWKPNLTTDENGKTSFSVTFPDDVTKWNTYVLAVSPKKLSGKVSSSIKSFKPLMAELFVPRFMVQGDTANVIGKMRNYLPDSVNVVSEFKVNDTVQWSMNRNLTEFVVDTFSVNPTMNDTINLEYALRKSDGYSDGERRNIPVIKKGMQKTLGTFIIPVNDSSYTIQTNEKYGEVHVYASSDAVDILEKEVNELINYKFNCNEQLASKLMALMLDKQLSELKGKPFKHKAEARLLINLLVRNQNSEGMWGWWNKSENSLIWISKHVMESLKLANENGFEYRLRYSPVDTLILKLDKRNRPEDLVEILTLLQQFNAKADYHMYLESLQLSDFKTFSSKLEFAALQQKLGFEIDAEWIVARKKVTIFGNVYFGGSEIKGTPINKNIANTLRAYQILKSDSSHIPLRAKIQNFLMDEYATNKWVNTYQKSQILLTILPDLMQQSAIATENYLTINGAITDSITKFPYKATFSAGDSLTIAAKGFAPIYFTAYQQYCEADPVEKQDDFVIQTSINGKHNEFNLTAGKEVTLKVNLEIKKTAEYVMIEVPIPAGCSYASKRQGNRNEEHREYFKEKVSVFCGTLPEGEYVFNIKLLPRYTGSYGMNPAKVELMYFPTFYSNTSVKSAKIF